MPNIVAKSTDDVTFTFTPQEHGFASLEGAKLFDSNSKLLQEWTGQNVIQFQAPAGDSRLDLAYLDGPKAETWSLSYTTAGVTKTLWTNLSMDSAPSSITVFGS